VNRPSLGAAFVLATLCACTSTHRERFPTLESASRHVVSVLSSDATLDRYRSAAASFATELEHAAPTTATGRERLDRYRDVNKGLQDILAVWEAKSSGQQELLPLSSPLAGRLAKEWELPVNTNEPPSIYASEAMQTIWRATKKKIEELDNAESR
jgi:hypothetical protein